MNRQRTRTHSSRMRTICCSGHLPQVGGVCPGVSAREVSARGVSAQGGICWGVCLGGVYPGGF